MDKSVIIEKMGQANGIVDIEEIGYKSDFLVLRFFYEYDDDELDAARDYANTESSEEDDEDKWYNEYYKPYIIDIAVDEVRDTLEELVESQDVNAEYISYEPEMDDDSLEFIAVFTDRDNEFDIDDVLDELNL